MDSSDGELDSRNAMDVVTSDDSLQDIPIGNLGLPESGPFKLGTFESGPSGLGPFGSALLAPLTVVMLDNLETDETLSSRLVSHIADRDRDIVPLTVYVPDSDLEDVSDHHDWVWAPSHPLSLPLSAKAEHESGSIAGTHR